MELTFTTNTYGLAKYRIAVLNGREHYVVPMALINPGVLAGSKGPLFYPVEEVHRNIKQWNGMPLTLGHPVINGVPVSARAENVLNNYSLGTVLNARTAKSGKLIADGWFDVEVCKKRAPEVLEAIRNNQPIELSTGLYTQNILAANGANHRGIPYTYVAKNYEADHVAILLHEKGACSLKDGCGTFVSNCKTGENAGKPGPCPTSTTGVKRGPLTTASIEKTKEAYQASSKTSADLAKASKSLYDSLKAHSDNPNTKIISIKVHEAFAVDHDRMATKHYAMMTKTQSSTVLGEDIHSGMSKSEEHEAAAYAHQNAAKAHREAANAKKEVQAKKQSKGKPTTNGWSEAARIAAILARRTGRTAKRLVKTAVKKKVGEVKSEVQRVRDAIAKKGQKVVDTIAGKKPTGTPPPLPKRDKAKPPPLPQKRDRPKPPPLPQRKDTTPYKVKEAEKQGKRSAMPEAKRVKKAIRTKKQRRQKVGAN